MRSRAAVIGVIVAVCAAVAGIALAVAAMLNVFGSGASPTPSGSASAEPVTADDFCYVEAMIYYRVEAVDLAKAVLDKDGISSGTRAFAQDLVDEQSAQLEQLRPWYVSWKGARPLERPDEGPCAGHGGSTHVTMPGQPTTSQWNAFLAADGAEAEKIFLDLLTTQNTAMIAFAEQVLAGDPNSRVVKSAHDAIARAEADNTELESLAAGLP